MKKSEWSDWMKMRVGYRWYRQKVRKETVHEMKRWMEGMIGREQVSLDQSYVMHFTVLHFSIALSPSLSLSLSLSAVRFSATYALTTDSCSPWERERPALAHTNDSRSGRSAKRRDFKHSNLIACTCINKNRNISVINASNAAYSAQYYVFAFHHPNQLQTDKSYSKFAHPV